MPARRYFPRAVVNLSEADETALMVAYAMWRAWEPSWHMRLQLQNWGKFFLALSVLPAFTGCALIVMFVEHPDYMLAALGVTAGLISLAILLYVVSRRQTPQRSVQHLVKAFWPIERTAFAPGHLWWDAFAGAPVTLQCYGAPRQKLNDLEQGLRHTSLAIKDEPLAIEQLGQMRTALEALPRETLALPLVLANDLLLPALQQAQPVLRLLADKRGQFLPRLPGQLPAQAPRARAARAYLAVFLSDRPAEFLRQWWQQVETELGAWRHYFDRQESQLVVPETPATINASAHATVQRLTDSTRRAFAQVIQTLGVKIQPSVEAAVLDYQKEAKDWRWRTETRLEQKESSWKSELDRLTDKTESEGRVMADLERDLRQVQSQILELTDGQGSQHWRTLVAETRRAINILSTLPDSSDKSAEMQRLSQRLNRQQTVLSRVDAQEKAKGDLESRSQTARQRQKQLQRDIGKRQAEIETEKRTLQLELQVQLAELQKTHEARVKELEKPLAGTREHETGVYTALQAARHQTEHANPHPPRPNGSTQFERQIIAFRRQAFETLKERAQKAINTLTAADAQTRQTVDKALQTALALNTEVDEILLPVWLARYSDSSEWEPLASLCEALPQPPTERTLFHARLAETRCGELTQLLNDRAKNWDLDESLTAHCALARPSETVQIALHHLQATHWIDPTLASHVRTLLATTSQESQADNS